MADTYEKDLAQKSSLTTSDFIRVVGSDNASYKQVLTSVLDTFNTNLPIRQLSASSFVNLDTQLSAISADIRYFSTVNGTDGPNSRNRWTVIGFNNGTSTYAFQWAMTFDGRLYERHKSNSSTWSAWVTQPTRAEVDALNSKTSGAGTAENQYCSYSYTYIKRGNICQLYVEATPKQVINNSTGAVNLSDIPKPATSSYSATYDPSSASTICGSAELDGAKNVSFYGARTAGHVYKAGFTYAID